MRERAFKYICTSHSTVFRKELFLFFMFLAKVFSLQNFHFCNAFSFAFPFLKNFPSFLFFYRKNKKKKKENKSREKKKRSVKL